MTPRIPWLLSRNKLCDPQVWSPRQWAFCLPQKEDKRIQQVDLCTARPKQGSTSYSLLQSRPALTSKQGFHFNGSEILFLHFITILPRFHHLSLSIEYTHRPKSALSHKDTFTVGTFTNLSSSPDTHCCHISYRGQRQSDSAHPRTHLAFILLCSPSGCLTVSDRSPLPQLQQGEARACGADVTDQLSYFQVDDVAYTVLNFNSQQPNRPTSAPSSPRATETVYSEVKKK